MLKSYLMTQTKYHSFYESTVNSPVIAKFSLFCASLALDTLAFPTYGHTVPHMGLSLIHLASHPMSSMVFGIQ